MSRVYSKDFIIPKPKAIPYGGGEERNIGKYLKRSSQTHHEYKLIYFCRRLRNYVCCVLAYIAPSNKIRVALNRWKGVHIADGSYVGMFCFIDNAYPEYIFIEENVSVNAGCYLIAHFNPMPHFRRTVLAKVAPIVIKKGAMIGVRSIVDPGVTIGEYAMVAENSVVNRDIPPLTIVRGNPASEIGIVRLEKGLHNKVEI